MPLGVGEQFAGYTVIRLLGAGGMGEVYLAKHPRLPRHDALKVLPTAISADPDFRTRFEREADLAATLWHPHIVGVHDRGDFEGRLWIAMDYVAGHDAAALLRDQYPTGMPTDQVAQIVTAVAEALDHAHHRHLLHRDVKPANILLTDDTNDKRRILLADFGIARHTEDTTGLTATNMTVGSVNYTAPEQLMGEPLDGRTDQYALAATAHHLLTGTSPFPHPNPAVVISRHLNTPPPALATTHPPLAPADPILATALAKNPTDRYPTTTDFATALTQALTNQTPTTTTTPTAAPATTNPTPVTLTDDATTLVEKPTPTPPPVHVSQWGTPPTDEIEEEERLVVPSAPLPPVPPRRGLNPVVLGVAVAAAIVLVAMVTFAILQSTVAGSSHSAPPITSNVPRLPTTTTGAAVAFPTATAPVRATSPGPNTTDGEPRNRSNDGGGGPLTIRPDGAAQSVVDLVDQKTGFHPTDVKCPGGVEAKVGTEFDCIFTGPDGQYNAHMQVQRIDGDQVLFQIDTTLKS